MIINQPLVGRDRVILPPHQVGIHRIIRESFRQRRSPFCLSKQSLYWA